MDVYKKHLYLVQDQLIRSTCVHNFNTGTESKLRFKPKLNKISRLAFAKGNILLCTDFEAGEVYEYNTENDTTIMVPEGLEEPSYISVNHTLEGTRYILSVGSGLSSDRYVLIYNGSWQFLTFITQDVSDPRDITPFPGGFLVADHENNKVNLYSYTGNLLRTVLTEHAGIKHPNSLTFMSSFLWVTQCYQESAKILCFKIVNNTYS